MQTKEEKNKKQRIKYQNDIKKMSPFSLEQYRQKSSEESLDRYHKSLSKMTEEEIKIKRDAKREYDRQYRIENREKVLKSLRQSYQKNRTKRIKEKKTDLQKNPISRIKLNLRNRLGRLLKTKMSSKTKLIGCSAEELRQHLEKNFYNRTSGEAMSWKNYGKNGWEIDHKTPLAKFDLSKEEDILVACHFSNLQPLWQEDNRAKGDK